MYNLFYKEMSMLKYKCCVLLTLFITYYFFGVAPRQCNAQNSRILKILPEFVWTNSHTNVYCGIETTTNLQMPSWKPVSPLLWDMYITCFVVSTECPLTNINSSSQFFRVVSSTNSLYVDTTTLNGKVMFGYQGWFGTPEDGSIRDDDWQHWSVGTPAATNMTVDFWPDFSEYETDELQTTSLFYANGSTVSLYSAYKEKTVKRHMRWLRDYNLDGVFLQRFVTSLRGSNNFDFVNKVLSNVQVSCEFYGRSFVIMYDIVSADESNLINQITNDWCFLVDTLKITESPSYQRHHRKPVVSFCGIGYNDRPGTPEQIQELINWFRDDAALKYQATVFGNVATHWRTLDGDSKTNSAWADVYRDFDILSPWTVGRYTNSESAIQFCFDRILPDIAATSSNNIDYMPVVFPGFSFHNLSGTNSHGDYPPLNEIPRMGGNFLWTQFYQWQKAGAKMIYIAMFDEIDEGTAMYKLAPTSNDIPVGVDLVTLDIDGYSLPSDWYLQLAREGKRMLNGKTELTNAVPISP